MKDTLSGGYRFLFHAQIRLKMGPSPFLAVSHPSEFHNDLCRRPGGGMEIDMDTLNPTTKNKNYGIISTICLLLIMYIVLAAVDAMGFFVMGTYESENKYASSSLVLEFGGKTDDKDWTYKVEGKEIIFYYEGEETVTAKVSNGVIKYELLGMQNYCCKNGKSKSDYGKTSFVDMLRNLLSPASKIISDLLY